MPATNHAMELQIKKDFGGENYAPPATYYLGLSTSAIDANGNTAQEPSDIRYARQPITNTDMYWTTGLYSNSMTNTSDIQFDESAENWGTIVAVFLADAPTGGNIWYYYTLSPSVPVVANTTIQFGAGSLIARRT